VRVLYFGTYERDYPSNALTIDRMRAAGVDVFERHVGVWDGRRHKYSLSASAAARLARAELELLRRDRDDFDVLVVGYPGHFDIPAARRIARGRPVVFNPLVSLEDTMVGDRGLVGSGSPAGRALHAVDRYAFRRADLVVADTATHGRYLLERFGLAAERVEACFVGAEDGLFEPGPRSTEFSVLFVGKLIPLHGVEVILDAAARLPDIEFTIVGSGQLDPLLAAHPANVRWNRWVDYRALPALYHAAGCALGIFGTTSKAARVIPNKAFQALATQTALVTGDTPASRELLEDGRDALLIPVGDGAALATAIRRLADGQELRARVAAAGRATYVGRASRPVLGARWRSLLERVLRA
jgi:glycosyltransferase involved in cell wall biosynthesis